MLIKGYKQLEKINNLQNLIDLSYNKGLFNILKRVKRM